MSQWFQLGLQNGNSPLMEQLIFFHDHALLVVILITSLVGFFLAALFSNKFLHRYLLDGQAIETVWTVIPAIILVAIALPSIRLLYLIDEIHNPALTIKVTGHQWYWSYEYSDLNDIQFDSYMIPSNELSTGMYRLLDVDNRSQCPMIKAIRLMITSDAVLHSWAVPSLGIKMDADPGRLNQSSLLVNMPGVFYGQCSEICGSGHSFMPIVIEAVGESDFLKWLELQIS
uniref:Cytochrome c oxidase subunit 2 n=2 Tax=Artemia franciscana TaxID=6661 RepID=COX2_ARTSF|nr:RecName: Full=Cytochrome c oxidase subunit 2; AltName: Full=Cytochrome c oxidase polypeptide II [Artemia franciscana]CAA48807.1 cytochrome-c oxidase [Artemia franciscana]